MDIHHEYVSFPSDDTRDQLIEMTDNIAEEIADPAMRAALDIVHFELLEWSSDSNGLDPIVLNRMHAFTQDVGWQLLLQCGCAVENEEDDSIEMVAYDDPRAPKELREFAEYEDAESYVMHLKNLDPDVAARTYRRINHIMQMRELAIFFLAIAGRFDIATNDAIRALQVRYKNGQD